ncbi:MAG: Methyltransferase [Candidatus Jettenia ecosi]|uniref:site-specific DNA-methyltransferase (cytosine-N(4)-specific) n=1 Tax=Candidatus Jettenia ecosi TaxID=2494326 RepID=A0A533QDU6_9BACT|nr:MAG: Methyltransferase [Candidatus Jettenia ecosi]
MQLGLPGINDNIDVRRKNVLSSPKFGGSCDIDSKPYLKGLGVEIVERKQPIQFTSNFGEHVHKWAPYIQGFSAVFVQSILDQYKDDYTSPMILDPFAGCGTVLTQSKLNSYKSIGTELNPLLQFIANVKVNSWDVDPKLLLEIFSSISKDIKTPAPEFLKSKNQFNPGVLRNLEFLKGGIDAIPTKTKEQTKVKNLILLAFSSILIDCSNLKRTPCLGYWKGKRVADNAPWILMEYKVKDICKDLEILQTRYKRNIFIESKVLLVNAMEYRHKHFFDLVITSPPYMNGLDYVMNYKIEMAWLGFTQDAKDAKKVKDSLVVCDNVSKGLIKTFVQLDAKYSNSWIEEIKTNIEKNIKRRGNYRRNDMPHIVHKYFDDMYKVMSVVTKSLKSNGRFILVVGDSLIADVYVPTDLLLAKIGTELGLTIEKIEKARNRRSGQIRNYRLRETIITLKKN